MVVGATKRVMSNESMQFPGEGKGSGGNQRGCEEYPQSSTNYPVEYSALMIWLRDRSTRWDYGQHHVRWPEAIVQNRVNRHLARRLLVDGTARIEVAVEPGEATAG